MKPLHRLLGICTMKHRKGHLFSINSRKRWEKTPLSKDMLVWYDAESTCQKRHGNATPMRRSLYGKVQSPATSCAYTYKKNVELIMLSERNVACSNLLAAGSGRQTILISLTATLICCILKLRNNCRDKMMEHQVSLGTLIHKLKAHFANDSFIHSPANFFPANLFPRIYLFSSVWRSSQKKRYSGTEPANLNPLFSPRHKSVASVLFPGARPVPFSL